MISTLDIGDFIGKVRLLPSDGARMQLLCAFARHQLGARFVDVDAVKVVENCSFGRKVVTRLCVYLEAMRQWNSSGTYPVTLPANQRNAILTSK